MKIAQVFVEHPIMHLDHTFTYACDGFSLQRGVRVQVPFGKTSIIGFVMKVETITEQQAAAYGFTKINIRTCKAGNLGTLCEGWGCFNAKTACGIAGSAEREGNASFAVLSNL